MKRMLLITVTCFFTAAMTGCTGYIIPAGYYVAPNGYDYYSNSYNVALANARFNTWDSGILQNQNSHAHYAKSCGPTPFEAVFGKGALKQPHNNHNGHGRH